MTWHGKINTNVRRSGVITPSSAPLRAAKRAGDSVRITAGALKGRQILTPGGHTHPMGERERLALFNMVMADLPGAAVLDAYAGSGALGITALSLGAKTAVFIEKDPQAAAIIRENLQNLGLMGAGTVYNGTVGDFVAASTSAKPFQLAGGLGTAEQASGTAPEPFQLVLADPPYDNFHPIEVKNLAALVAPGGILALSHPGAAPVLPGLDLTKTRQYAAAHISLYLKLE